MEINGDQFVANMYANKNKLESKADDAQYVGGMHIGGFGIKNTGMLHFMQTNAQAEAIAAPGAYAEGIENLIKSLKEVQDMAATPYHNG